MTLYRRLIRKVHKLQDRLQPSPDRVAGVPAFDGAHALRSVERAPRSDAPSPHLYVEQLFSDADYARILAALPKSDLTFDYWMDRDTDPSKGASGEYRKRYDLDLRKASTRIGGEAGAFWLAVHQALTSKPFVRGLLARYADVLADRYQPDISDADFDARFGVDAFLMRHEPNYYLGPHTDRRDRMVTGVIYLPADDRFPELGTSFFVPKADLGDQSGPRQHFGFDKFQLEKTMRYVPNTAVIFPQTDYGYHGVLPIKQDRQVAVRYGMQVQIYDRLARGGGSGGY